MPKYEITTESRFILKYFVEAESASEAIDIAMDGEADAVQLHLGEDYQSCKEIEETEKEWFARQNMDGYF